MNKQQFSHRNGEIDEPQEPGWYWFDGHLAYAVRGVYPRLRRPVRVEAGDDDEPPTFWYGRDGEPTDACADSWLHGQWWGPLMTPWEDDQTERGNDES